MDRSIVYSQEQGRSTDFLFAQRAAMVGLAKLSAAVFGTSTVVNGLACAPTSPASLQVQVGAGEIYALAPIDATDYGVLPADTTDQILKQGISLVTTTLSCPAPSTGGFSINYLVQVAYQDSDTTNVVLPFFNSANPSQPLLGQNNSGTEQPTERQGIISISVKAGAAATTGTQTTPTPDAGYIGLYVVTVANGQSSIMAGSISQYSGAPFLQNGLLGLAPTFNVSPTGPTPLGGDNSTKFSTTAFSNAAGAVVGSVRNATMHVAAASATSTFTADEVIVETALGGAPIRLANFNKTINLAATGAGGMDTGTAPVSGYVAIYAIYNPTTQTAALLAQNANALRTEVYSGANMPAGYTASALLGVVPTNASSQFVSGALIGRKWSGPDVSVYNSNSSVNLASLSLAAAVPINAKRCDGWIVGSNTNASASGLISIFSNSAGTVGRKRFEMITQAAGSTMSGTFSGLELITAQTVWFTVSAGTGTPGANIGITSYEV